MQEHIYYNALNILFDGAIISLEKECQKYYRRNKRQKNFRSLENKVRLRGGAPKDQERGQKNEKPSQLVINYQKRNG